ncbi:hypothetical protein VN1027_10360 [Helicobacter pylori]|uniref:hypothetical protein n=1 Tax=Helicobacter pylori TaxID=210 RepID=UPI001AA376E9|nr:hypothetical protein [Helicobacter pylori]UOR66827.1 hypothetical protein MPG15_02355 [Helicobacter pylori]GHS21086.1 hypothetical protein VN1027_10360 [Helicobacter pylori]
MDVHVNADELEKFAHEIKSFLETQQNATSRLRGAFNRVKSSWQDNKCKEFENNFSDLLVGFLGLMTWCKVISIISKSLSPCRENMKGRVMVVKECLCKVP